MTERVGARFLALFVAIYAVQGVVFAYFMNSVQPYMAAAGVHFARVGALGPFVRAKLAALAGMPGALRKRRLVQQTRRVDAAALRPLLETGWISTKLREKRFDTELAGGGR